MFSGVMFSGHVPYGAAVPAYSRQRGDTRLPMNVRKEADEAYVADKGLKSGPTILKSWPIGACSRCRGMIHNAPYLSASGPGKFCSRECRDGDAKAESETRRRRTRQFMNCKQCWTRFQAKRTDQEFCKPKCRARWNRNQNWRTDNCHDHSGTRMHTGGNEGVFAV